jgi:hypothetical protein
LGIKRAVEYGGIGGKARQAISTPIALRQRYYAFSPYTVPTKKVA